MQKLFTFCQQKISFTFDSRDMLLSLHIGFSFVRDAVTWAILERTYCSEPSTETIAPRYLKFVIVPSFSPLTLISLWMPLAPIVNSLVFSAVISISYFVQIFSELSVWASCSCSSSARASVSLAKCRFYHLC